MKDFPGYYRAELDTFYRTNLAHSAVESFFFSVNPYSNQLCIIFCDSIGVTKYIYIPKETIRSEIENLAKELLVIAKLMG